jgi:flagellar hook-associated protein 1 FlgK
MGLTSSLQIGRSALSASQVALQMTGNNIANAATPGYHRQRITLAGVAGDEVGSGLFVGRGVKVADLQRVVSPALQARVRSSVADQSAARVQLDVLNTIESMTNELTGIDLSTQLGRFFNAFSELANNTSTTAMRSTVIEEGAAVASYVGALRGDLAGARSALDDELGDVVERADQLVEAIATMNREIINAEQGRGVEGGLRDQRDRLLLELSELVDISVTEQPMGTVDVLVGSIPVILGTVSRGLQLDTFSGASGLEVRVMTRDDPEVVDASGGRIGGLIEQRSSAYDATIADLDTLSAELIFQVNRLHSSGRPEGRLTDTTGWQRIPAADQTLALNDPANATLAALPFAPRNGSFTVRVHDGNGNASATTIAVDLDGIDATGAPGFGDDTSLADLVAALDAIPNLNARVTPSGELRVFTDAGFDVSFEDDSSGALAVLGINTFFAGHDATNIAVRQELRDDASLLVTGAGLGTNETALAIASLREEPVRALGGSTLIDRWLSTVERNAVATNAASTRFEALTSVRDSLEAQEAAYSGVSLDEESVNLITYQQQYQGAARFIAVTDELTDVLLSLV